MATIDEFLRDATQRMDKSVETTHEHFNSVRTGRASAALLDRIQIDYYGTPTPLKNIATINVPEPRLLTIQPRLVPVIRLRPEKDADYHDQEVDRDRKPIVVHHVLTDSPKDHVPLRPLPQTTQDRNGPLIKVREIASDWRTQWLPIRSRR